MSDAEEICVWREEEWGWQTGCGHSFSLNEGTPSQNFMRFCCYCGLPLVENPQSQELEEEDRHG